MYTQTRETSHVDLGCANEEHLHGSVNRHVYHGMKSERHEDGVQLWCARETVHMSVECALQARALQARAGHVCVHLCVHRLPCLTSMPSVPMEEMYATTLPLNTRQ